ncbi:hypothetical protein D0B32_29890 [Paraburkholderia sp. DHOC27]|nr:hypothetical protein D0B32_29890 [Paraburkholderia sp. DHOC27]
MHPLDDTPRARLVAAAAGVQHHPFGANADTNGAPPALASPDTPIPPLDNTSAGSAINGRWIFSRGLIALVVVLLAYGAYTLFGSSRNTTPADGDNDTQSTGGSIGAYAPGNSSSGSIKTLSGSSANASANGSTSASTNTATNTSPDAASPRASAAMQSANNAAVPATPVIQPPVAPHYRDLSESLHAARTYFDANDLSDAQAAVNAAFSMQANSADAQVIQRDLRPLEQRRDAAMQTALVCIKDNLWNCVEHSARDALAIDTGSVEAKAMLERAIVETGWTPLHNKPATVTHNAPAAQTSVNEPPLPPLPPLPSTARSTQATQATPTAQAAPPAAVSPAAPAVATNAAPNSVDAQERAIAQFGWKNSATPGATPASGAAAAH